MYGIAIENIVITERLHVYMAPELLLIYIFVNNARKQRRDKLQAINTIGLEGDTYK